MATDPGFLQPFVNFVASGLGALAAGYFGVLWALRQRRGERAFDRRVEWTEQMHAALYAAAHTQDRLYNITGFANVTPTDIEEADREADEAYRNMRRLAEQRRLFAPPKTALQLDRVLEEINRILVEAVSVKTSGRDEGWGAKRTRSFGLAQWLREAADVLVDDVHAHLGYRSWWTRRTSKAKTRMITRAELERMQTDKPKPA